MKIGKSLILLGLLLFTAALCIHAKGKLSPGDYKFESIFHDKAKCEKTFLASDCSAKNALTSTPDSLTVEINKKTNLVAIKGSCGKYLDASCGEEAEFTSNKAKFIWEALVDKDTEGEYRFQLATKKPCAESFLRVRSKKECGIASLVLNRAGSGNLRFELEKTKKEAKKPNNKKKKNKNKKKQSSEDSEDKKKQSPEEKPEESDCVSTCPAGKYISTACSTKTDAVCSNCSLSCDIGEYIDQKACTGKTTTNLAICSACTADCAASEVLDVSACTGNTTTNGAVCRGLELVYVFDNQRFYKDVALVLGGTVNVKIDWGDGSTESVTTAGWKEHTYTNYGTFNVKVTGTLTEFGTISGIITGNGNLESVLSFGNLGITHLVGAFRYATSLKSVPEMLPSTVTDTNHMFAQTNVFNGDISGWDVSNVENMEAMFVQANEFNADISKWDVSSATNMARMFSGAPKFNQDISKWVVSQVTNMKDMFFEARAFEANISGWTLSGLTAFASCQTVLYNSGITLQSALCSKAPQQFFTLGCITATC